MRHSAPQSVPERPTHRFPECRAQEKNQRQRDDYEQKWQAAYESGDEFQRKWGKGVKLPDDHSGCVLCCLSYMQGNRWQMQQPSPLPSHRHNRQSSPNNMFCSKHHSFKHVRSMAGCVNFPTCPTS